MMDIDLTTPALLFPAISLLLLAFTNRFLALATLIRNLHDKYLQQKDKRLLGQIKNLRRRLLFIRLMQGFGIGSMFMCVFTMMVIFSGNQPLGRIIFGVSMGMMLVSLAMSFIEVQLSSRALIIHLSDLEESDLRSTEPSVRKLFRRMIK
jgi:hypothetical protein